MLSIVLALAAASQSVIDAERAFAKMAQDKGQWTAFRATAAPGAILFWPRPTPVEAALKDLKDPPKAVRWWPTKAWLSCDKTLGVTTGGTQWPDGRWGWFTTVWQRQPGGGYKWVLDNGGFTKLPRPEPATVIAEQAARGRFRGIAGLDAQSPGEKRGTIASQDGSLAFDWFNVSDTTRFQLWSVRPVKRSRVLLTVQDPAINGGT